jgi:hypothetical protein
MAGGADAAGHYADGQIRAVVRMYVCRHSDRPFERLLGERERAEYDQAVAIRENPDAGRSRR